MAELWVGNVADEVTDEEIREFLCRYGFPPFDTIQRVEGSGDRPAVVLGFNDVGAHVLQSLQPRVHNMFWKDRTIVVQVVPARSED
ncbi:RNA-binding protein [Paraburkholderia sp. C35]|uniref:RNA recognition motif domain-containing protein n=1 Tax=Paraburkholderia sp. C35 TaxID=2126993 RepID=UPI000D694F6B|nr:RNA-binding protein [Paraburkholderia sp. C35]